MKKISKSLVSVFMSFVFVVGYLIPTGNILSAAAATPVLNNGVYQISNADELLWVAENSEKNYILTQDIDISDKADWVPLGNELKPFSGVFNGAGHTITVGIDQTKSESGIYTVGLFGYLSGTIANLTVNGLIKASIHSGYVGTIAANIAGGMIINCDSNVQVTAEGIGTGKTGIVHVGGIAGAVRSGFNVANIKNCINNGTINVKSSGDIGSGDLGDGTRGTVGGILGFTCTASSANITNSINKGNIVVDGGKNDVGGIVGMTSSNNDNSKAIITYCANKGNITINNLAGERAAGIIGYIKNGVINYCYNTGNIIAYSDNGTTVSRLSYGTYYGIFGYANLNTKTPLEVKYCYNASSNPLEAEICLVRNPANGTFRNFYMQGREEYELQLGGTAGNAGTAFTSASDLLTKITATEDGAKAYVENPIQDGFPVLFYEVASLSDSNYSDNIKVEALSGHLNDIYFVLQTNSSINPQEITVTANVLNKNTIIATLPLVKGNTYKAGELNYSAATGCNLFYGTIYNISDSWSKAEITVKKGSGILYKKAIDNTDYPKSVQIPIGSLPDYPDGVVSIIYNAGPGIGVDQASSTAEDTQMVVVSETSESVFQTYIQTLLTSGFTKITENKIENNLHYLLKKDAKYIYLYYTAFSKTVRIIEDKSTSTELSQLDLNPKGTGKTEFYLYSIDYTQADGQYSKTNYWSVDCGACLVVKLADNSVFIVDGGHQRQSSKAATDGFMKFLYEVTGKDRAKGEKINIRGWFFSHAHDDHIYFSKALIDNYHDYINLDSLLFNFPSYQVINGGYALSTFEVKKSLKTYYPNCNIIKLHTGQTFNLQGVVFNVMYTHEDAVSNSGTSMVSNFNDSTTVLKMTMDGKSFMLLGDCSGGCRDTLLKMYTSVALKSDCVQVAHHNYDDHPTLYAAISAPLALFCNSEKNAGYNSGNQKKYLGVINAATNVVPLFADPNTYKITVENGDFVYKTVPSYRSDFKTLRTPALSETLITGTSGFKEDTNYVTVNKTSLLDKVIDRSVLGSVASTIAETNYMMLDGSIATKYRTDSSSATVVWSMKEAVTVDSYIIYTANDAATNAKRNPNKWVLCGSNDGEKWSVLDSVSSANLPDANSKGFAFKISSLGSYQYYAVKFFAAQGATGFQISELGLYSGDTSETQSVIDRINNLPTNITIADKSEISSIRAVYNNLSAQNKTLVTNYSVLKAAEDVITSLTTIKVSSVKITGTNTSVTVGGTKNLKASILPLNATNKTIVWSSSSVKVATVSQTGKVTAKSAGTAVIKVIVDGKTAFFNVIVIPKKPTKFNVTNKNKQLIVKYKKDKTMDGVIITIKKGSKKYTYKTTKTTYKTSKKFAKGKYKVTICAYKKVSGKDYKSAKLTAKTIKIK